MLEEELFEKVKEYLYTHNKCDITELSKATGVAASRIFGYLKEGKLGLTL